MNEFLFQRYKDNIKTLWRITLLVLALWSVKMIARWLISQVKVGHSSHSLVRRFFIWKHERTPGLHAGAYQVRDDFDDPLPMDVDARSLIALLDEWANEAPEEQARTWQELKTALDSDREQMGMRKLFDGNDRQD